MGGASQIVFPGDLGAPGVVLVVNLVSLYFNSLLHGCSKASEPGICVVMAALCWHKYCPLNTSGPLLPLLFLLYSGKGILINCLCPTELNRSKLMIKGMTGDNAL